MSKKPKLTGWISGESKPSLIGVYSRNYRASKNGDSDLGIVYSHWNGKRWGLYAATPRQALQWKEISSSHQALPWRGLAEKPGE